MKMMIIPGKGFSVVASIEDAEGRPIAAAITMDSDIQDGQSDRQILSLIVVNPDQQADKVSEIISDNVPLAQQS